MKPVHPVKKRNSFFSTVKKTFSPTCGRPLCPAGIFALAKLPCGVCATVKALNLAHDEAEKLRGIGIREGCRISLISRHNPMLVAVENTRIALSHRLAPQVQVQSGQGEAAWNEMPFVGRPKKEMQLLKNEATH